MNQSPTVGSPRPSVAALQLRFASELSTRVRVIYTLLLLLDLVMGAVVVSLWATEPSLPRRTHVAFGLLVTLAVTWAVVLIWTLLRRRVLMARHRVLMTRLAVFFTGLFTTGALVLAATTPHLRDLGGVAAACGGAMVLVAWMLNRRARLRCASLVARADALAIELGVET
ncbi:MAG: hypothetical protein K8J08_18105 [Thermoanaerobaculia bacterium]|nr:hypothetical protein [Thermoanaerobaculia bacterium]